MNRKQVMESVCLQHTDTHPLAVNGIESADSIAQRQQSARELFKSFEMPPAASFEAGPCDLRRGFRMTDGVVDSGCPQVRCELEVSIPVRRRLLLVTSSQREYPA